MAGKRFAALGLLAAGAIMIVAGYYPDEMKVTFVTSGCMFIAAGSIFLTTAKKPE